MLSSKLPTPKDVNDVQPGSLVLIPEQNKWGIGMAGGGLFILQNGRPGNANGKVADFGQGYRIQLDLLTASRASYPWVDDARDGDLIVFSENNTTTSEIVLGRQIGSGQLSTFDIRTGNMHQRGSNDGEALSYLVWRIDVLCSDDEKSVAKIYSRDPAQP